MIEIRDLRFSYPASEFHLAVPKLGVERGSATAIIGPSGCGKSTLLRMIAGIQTPDAGSISVAGNRLEGMSDADRRRFRIANIGFVFQEFALLEYLTVLDNVLLPYYINKAMKLDGAARKRAMGLCEQLGLADKLNKKPETLSQGEKQRAAICRALVNRPALVLADEPTGNLDPSNKHLTVRILRESAREANATLLVVTHDHSLLEGFDRVIDAAEFSGAGAVAS